MSPVSSPFDPPVAFFQPRQNKFLNTHVRVDKHLPSGKALTTDTIDLQGRY